MLLARIADLSPPVLVGEGSSAFRIVGVSSEDDGAPNWTVRTDTPASLWRRDVARVIKQLQLEYALDSEEI